MLGMTQTRDAGAVRPAQRRAVDDRRIVEAAVLRRDAGAGAGVIVRGAFAQALVRFARLVS